MEQRINDADNHNWLKIWLFRYRIMMPKDLDDVFKRALKIINSGQLGLMIVDFIMMHGRPINQISCSIEERGIIWVIDQDSRKRLDFFSPRLKWER